MALCAVVLATAACTAVSPGSPGRAAAGSPESALATFYDQKLSWGPCAPFATTDADARAFADPRYDCAKLEVPLDYARPDGRKAELGVLRQKALSPATRIGSLLLNPGGPGASGMSVVPAIFGRSQGTGPLAQRFDLVGFDPRGVGSSTPTIDCLTDAEQDAERAKTFADPSPAGVAAAEADSKLMADLCSGRVGNGVLADVGTRDVVKDVDILRAALGDKLLTYLGFSYGTQIGSTYAEAFPGNVRALVLDGALDPTETLFDRTVKQNAGFQQAFEAFGKWCTAQPAPCPLGTDPAQTTATYQALVRPLIDKPIPVGPSGRILSFPDAQIGVSQALYLSQFWPLLSKGLSALATGDGSILLNLADIYYERAPDGKYANTLEAFTAITCVDTEPITDRGQARALAEKVDAVAPFRSTGRGAVGALDPCAFWPVPPTTKPHIPQVQGLVPTLVISTTGDPATPYQAGVDLAKALGGSLLTFEGTQHTVALRGVTCVDDAVSRYLIDGTLPPPGTTCHAA